MSLLAPLFLLGLGAIALPVWLHRLQTQSPEREPFGSAMFLESSERRVHVKKQLRYLLLLAARILLLAVLAFAFAKPIIERITPASAGADATLQLIVVDTSLSMGHGERFARAAAIARDLFDDLDGGDRAQLVAAGGTIDVVEPPTNDAGALRRSLATLDPGPGRLDLGVLVDSLNGLIGDDEPRVRVHLVSDFQASGQPTRFGDLVPDAIDGRSLELTLHPAADGDATNSTVESMRRTPTGVDITVRGFTTDAHDRQLALSINGARQREQTLAVPAAGRAVVSFDALEFAPGDNRVEVVLTPADVLAADDTRFGVIENTPPAPVLVISADQQSLPATYIRVALEAAGSYRAEAVAVAALDARVLPRYPFIIVTDLGAVDQRLAAALTDYLNAGGAVLAALGEQALTTETLPVTGHEVDTAKVTVSTTLSDSVAWIDTSHPALAGTRGWRGVRVARAMPVEVSSEDRLLLTLDTGAALLIERDFGAGRLWLLTTSLDNSWSNLPVQPVFVSFMAEAAAYLAGEGVLDREQIVGASLTLKQSGGAAGQVVDPAGRTVLKLADTRRTQEILLNQTGFYEVYTPGRDALVAVNSDPRESDLATMSPDALARWRSAADRPAVAPAARAALESPPLELWPGLLLALVLIVLAESLLGNRYLGSGTARHS